MEPARWPRLPIIGIGCFPIGWPEPLDGDQAPDTVAQPRVLAKLGIPWFRAPGLSVGVCVFLGNAPEGQTLPAMQPFKLQRREAPAARRVCKQGYGAEGPA